MKETLLCAVVACACATVHAQVIDFESLPGGLPTDDLAPISDQFLAEFGVRFDLVDPVTLAPVGSPLIAKVGAPRTAFDGCGPDTPFALTTTGDTLLTDDASVSGEPGTLLLTYVDPVSEAAGVVLDVDRRSGGNFEEWTVEALDDSMQVLEARVLTAPVGDDVCTNNHGPGDATALGFAFDRDQADIHYIVLRYTGNVGNVGLAFDNFWPDSVPPAPSVTLGASPPTGACFGDTFPITLVPEGGLLAPSVQWQQASEDGEFADMEGERAFSLEAPVVNGLRYRAVVRDALEREVTTDEVVSPSSRAVTWSIAIETAPDSGDFTEVSSSVTPFVLPTSIESYYGWSNGEEYYHGAVPTLTLDRSHLFLTVGAGGINLLVVHDVVGPNGGGRAEMVLEFEGIMPVVTATDDPGDRYRGEGTSLLEVRHGWVSPNTDGFAAGPLPGSWSVDVRFSDVFTGNPTIEGMDSWFFVSAAGGEIELPLEEDRRVRLTASCPCIGDVTADGLVDLADLNLVLGNFGQTTDSGDTNGDGQVDLADLNAVLGAFGQTCP
ncbi:MAG: hypothetical protein NXI14_01905 [bacterium]|nr:hypothetical protein [bacterium]